MSSDLALVANGGALEFTADQRQMIRDTFAGGCSDGEFAVLMEIARARRLNPLFRQIHFVERWDSEKHRMVWSAQVSIDGLRAIAERTGLYAGQDEPEYVENPDGTLKLCKVRVWRKDWPRPAVGVAYWNEYVQTTRDKHTGKLRPTAMWARMPHVMLAKVAESIALRKAFPEDMGGLYSTDEMAQAEVGVEDAPAPVPAPAPKARAARPAPADPTDAWMADVAAVTSSRDAAAVWEGRPEALRAEPAQARAFEALATALHAANASAQPKVTLARVRAALAAKVGYTLPTPPDGTSGDTKAPRSSSKSSGDAAPDEAAAGDGAAALAAWRAHIADKPRADGRNPRAREAELCEVASSYLKRAPAFAAAGLADDALDAARFELRARGCGDPDALLHAVAARHHRRAA